MSSNLVNCELVTIELKKLAKLKEDSGKLAKMEVDLKNLKDKYKILKYLGRVHESTVEEEMAKRSTQMNETEQNHQPGAPNVIENKSDPEALVTIHSNNLTKLEEDSKKFAEIEAEFGGIQAKIDLLEDLDVDGNLVTMPLEELLKLAAHVAKIRDPRYWE